MGESITLGQYSPANMPYRESAINKIMKYY